jgi:hypothetical protein
MDTQAQDLWSLVHREDADHSTTKHYESDRTKTEGCSRAPGSRIEARQAAEPLKPGGRLVLIFVLEPLSRSRP